MTIYWMKMVALMGPLIYIYFSPENSFATAECPLGENWSWYSIWDLDLSNSWLALVYYSCSLCVYRKGGTANTEALFPQAEGKTNQDAWQSFQKAPIRHVMVLVFWSLKKYIYVPGELLPSLLGKVNMLFGRLRVGLRRHVLKQAAINVMK